MLEKIKQLADDAVALQNKLRMEAALREISALCAPMDAEQFEAAELAQHQAAREMRAVNAAGLPVVTLVADENLQAGDPVVAVSGKARKAAKK